MKKIEVKYCNVMNNVSFSGFKEKELDLFFSICFKLKEYGTDELKISFDELKELSNYQHKGLQRFYKDLDQIYKKLIELNFRYEDEERIVRFVLFNRYEIEKINKIVSIKINDDFKYILNDLTKMYTKFDLLDFVNLRSIYSKNTFKLLKQWESVKKINFEVTKFRELLGVPDSYNTDNFNKRVLKPVEDELKSCFKNLKVEKIRTSRTITNLIFSWEHQKRELESKEDIHVEITESLNDILEKAKRNRFLIELLTDSNVYKLTQMYEENELKKGLLYLHNSIKKDVPNFSYLIKVIESGIEEQVVKLKVISKDNQNDKNEQTKELESENSLFQIFSNMTENLQKIILEQAKEMYMQDVNLQKMIPMHERFFKVAEKQYVLKVLNKKHGEKS
ncbi:MAG: replication initiation protein [Fusobacteriaceae bacterium]